MKLIMCFLLLLPFASMVSAAPVRARRENVLSFLNDALSSVTTPAHVTAYRNPPSQSVMETESADTSDAKSTESFDTDGYPDAARGLDTHKIMLPKVAAGDNVPSGRKMGVDKASVSPVETNHGSRDPSDPDSSEGAAVDVQEDGKQDIRLSGDRVTDSGSQGANLRREAGRVNGPNGMLAPGQSREVLDRDSLEDNNGRLAAAGNSRDPDYDETREYMSAETYPIVAREQMPNRLSAPAKS